MAQQKTHAKPQQLTTSLDDAIAVFLDDRRARRSSPSTLRFYRERLGKFLIWCKPRNYVTLADIKPAAIRAYLIELQDRNLSDNTQHASARAIRALFNFCVNEELLDRSPMAKVTMPKVDKRIFPTLSADDIRKLLGAADNHRDRAVILFLIDTGVRATEFLNLTGADIDVGTGTVRVRRGKGGKDRTVFLGAKSRKTLLRHFAENGKPDPDEHVWTSQHTGQRLKESGLRQLLLRLGNRAGVAHCHAHTFRRTFAIEALRAGMNIFVLARLMGHSDIAILQRYLSIVETDLKRAHAESGPVDRLFR